MHGIGDVHRYQCVHIRHRLDPEMAGKNWNSAVRAFKRHDKGRCRLRAVDVTEQIESTIERVDVEALSVSEKSWLTGIAVLVASRAWLQRDALQQLQVRQAPELN